MVIIILLVIFIVIVCYFKNKNNLEVVDLEDGGLLNE